MDTDGCGCYGSDDGKMEVKTEKKSEARHKHEPEDKHKTDKNKLVYDRCKILHIYTQTAGLGMFITAATPEGFKQL